MALDRILHGGLPCRTEAQARAEIAEQRWREANAGRYAELERRFDGPIPPDMKRAAQNSPMALISADMRGLRNMAHSASETIRALRQAGRYAKDYLQQVHECRRVHTAAVRERNEAVNRILWEDQQARINASTAAMLGSIARAQE